MRSRWWIEYRVLSGSSMSGRVARDYLPSRLFLDDNTRFLDSGQRPQGRRCPHRGGRAQCRDPGRDLGRPGRQHQQRCRPGRMSPTSSGTGSTRARRTTSRCCQVVVTGYAKVAPGLDAIKSDLAAGSPVVIGISTYQNVPMEERDWPRSPVDYPAALPPITLPSGKDTGGHAILAVGYDDSATVADHPEFLGQGVGKQWLCLSPLRLRRESDVDRSRRQLHDQRRGPGRRAGHDRRPERPDPPRPDGPDAGIGPHRHALSPSSGTATSITSSGGPARGGPSLPTCSSRTTPRPPPIP